MFDKAARRFRIRYRMTCPHSDSYIRTNSYFEGMELKQQAQIARQSTKKLFEKLNRKKNKKLDDVVHQLHDDAFRY